MSKKWKYQLKYGLIWGLLVSFITAAFDLYSMTFKEVYLSEKNTIRTALFVLAGIFVVSYFSWKKKIKSETNMDLSHDNAVNK
ncbi:hypothetical protein [Flavobacterium sp. LS1P3]|jgi:hypothetical protein|uniref:hypothetical protein n=1 Tax=Flavobacterium sp. LS1P3 TaxID=3401720 RepID=UPI003AAA35CB